MLEQLTLTNFRQHRSKTFTFTPGFNVIRGANEDGKSTVLEALGYLLFGVKACRQSLDQVVTWNEKDSSLKVEGSLTFDGIRYQAKRGKSGAEINYVDREGHEQSVVGQGEVSRFFGSLLGVMDDSAHKIMIAKQKKITEALDQGSAKTAELIEDLANFGQLDEILDLIQTDLTTGSTKTAEGHVQQLELQLNDAQEQLAPADVAELDRQITHADTEIIKLNEAIDTIHKPMVEQLTEEVQNARLAQQTQARLQSDWVRVEADRLDAVKELADAHEQASVVLPCKESELVERIGIAENRVALRGIYEAMERLNNAYPEDYWDQDENALVAEMRSQSDAIAACDKRIAALQGDIRAAQAKLITESACGLCGKDLSDVPEVQQKNTAQQAIIDNANDLIRTETTHRETARDYYDALVEVNQLARPYREFAMKYPHVLADYSSEPPRLSWKGQVPAATDENIERLRQQLTALRYQQSAISRAEAQIPLLEKQLADHVARLAQIKADLAKTGQADKLKEISGRLRTAQESLEHQQKVLHGHVSQRDNCIRQKQYALEAYERQKQRVAELRGMLEEARQDLTDLQFNNALLKRVREARPVIADRLWNVVLSAVSAYTTQQRGVKSVVTKDGDGFKVNGQPIEGYSGSANDVLGLSIRVALGKTFLPACPFLIVDEPASACDANRSENMVSFLLTAGYPQVILVTHEELSEVMSDNLIQL